MGQVAARAHFFGARSELPVEHRAFTLIGPGNGGVRSTSEIAIWRQLSTASLPRPSGNFASDQSGRDVADHP